MLKLLAIENLLTSLQEISPPMLILSIVLHGILLSIPISSSFLGKSKLSKITSKNESLEWLPSHSDTEIFSATNMLVNPKPPEIDSLSIDDLSTVTKPPLPLPTPTMEIRDMRATEDLTIKADVERQQQETVNQENTDLWELKARRNSEDTWEQNSIDNDATQSMAQSNQQFDSRSTKTSTVFDSTVFDSEVSDASKSTRAQQDSVDSISVLPDQLNLQSSESRLQNSEKSIFDSIFISIQEEIVFTANLDFAQPNQFAFSKVGLEDIFGTAIGKTPNQVALLVKSKLEAQGFQVALIGVYGGGPLYEVKKGEFIRYLSFAPTVNKTEAIIVSWRTVPL
ncbi:MAG: hypothetical protein SAK29_32265 [Scytonema sp. PMC 1069.18]|nr:hypothetical protein [Scytonema sp. PMC 1069.18]MEC4885465.1 hypothetical protein [Scytonema sp. PMC 1070.18]